MSNISNIFESSQFQRDLYKYNLFGDYLNKKQYTWETDNESYILFNFDNGSSWLWTSDNISKEKVENIVNVISDNGELILKKELLKYFYSNIDIISNEEYGCYVCKTSKRPIKQVSGHCLKATNQDIEELADLWFLNCEENDPINKFGMTKEKCIKFITNWIETEEFFVWKNDDSEITCFASYNNINNTSIIEHAYTKKSYRGQGYMANLIFNMTEIIMKENNIPVLQTDINYAPSNKSYINVGFELDDVLIKIKYHKNIKQQDINNTMTK